MKRLGKIFFACLIMMQSFIGYLPMTVEAADEQEVGEFGALKTALESGTSVKLNSDIVVTEPIEIGTGDITIDVNGHNLKCTNASTNVGGSNGAMLKITKQNTNLNITNSGNVENGFLNEDSTDCRALYFDNKANGNTYTIEKVTFKNFHLSSAARGGAIYFGGAPQHARSGDFTLQNNKFVGNRATNGGAIYFATTASEINLTMNDNIFENNIVTCTFSSYYGGMNGNGGALYFDRGYTAVLSNNIFKENKANPDQSFDNYQDAASGGAIYAYGTNGYQLQNNKFIENHADRDGGAMVIYDDSNYRPLSISGKETLFYKNSGNRGGAIFIYNNYNEMSDAALEITEGTFEENEAVEDGGAINYTQGDRGYLKLKNALITGNTAVTGGGIWMCPTSTGKFHSTLGGAIYQNTATGSFMNRSVQVDARGNDIRYSVGNEPDEFNQGQGTDIQSVTISERNHKGNIINWYADEVDHRFTAGDKPVNIKDYQNRNTAFSLARNDDDNFDADIKFINNKAGKRGGAIATNWVIELGDPDIDITVDKKFLYQGQVYDVDADKQNLLPDAIYVNLYSIDKDGKETLLDSNVKLNKANKWTYTFTGLPAKYEGSDGQIYDYKYTVRESDESLLDNKNSSETGNEGTCLQKNCKITLTNRLLVPTDYEFDIEKVISGDTPKKASDFKFNLTADKQDGMKLPNELTKTITGEGKATFGKLEFTKPGTYKLNVQEVLGNDQRYTYDKSIWTVTVNVVEDKTKGALTIKSVGFTKNNEYYNKVQFNNIYIDLVNPKTGDNIYFNIGMLIVSVLGIAMLIMNRRFRLQLAEVSKK